MTPDLSLVASTRTNRSYIQSAPQDGLRRRETYHVAL
jgi:hypothetical protein